MASWRRSPLKIDAYSATALTLGTPTIQASGNEFNEDVSSISVNLVNPNPAAYSEMIYWWDGQDEQTEAVTYTGTITLNQSAWESYLNFGRDYGRLFVRAVGTEAFAADSATTSITIYRND